MQLDSSISSWIDANKSRNDFAGSLAGQFSRKGFLSDAQVAAVARIIAKNAEPKKEATKLATDKLFAAFDKAKASKLKRPVMHFEGFGASLAPVTGKNAGSIYIKSDAGEYLGKITGSQFHATRECTQVQIANVSAAMADPLGAAVAYGRRTGNCAICNRQLTDPVSVDRGIGPICAERFF